ncbi:AMP-binding protein [Crenothrix sp.]|uniref:ApeI family dehydratase n=1 Tax=Crenothrix sp. TaxID=3100433 RepID=UPI00374CE1BA
MSDNVIALSDCLLTERHPTRKIAYHDRQYFHADAFNATVRYWVAQLQTQPFERYALYTEDAYPFTVLLFAMFHAGKQVWIAGNNRPGTAQQLLQHDCQLIGDWNTAQPFDYQLTATDDSNVTLSPLNLAETSLVIFTSGSIGEPKPIEKRLIQFQLEISNLEKQWGSLLNKSEILSTVSHQHIYGLLFRVLWPLAADRCFHSSIYINPETLINNSQDIAACWVASPAHLKRLDQNSPWQGIASLTAVFSSGGVLHEAAKQQITAYTGQQVIEIYGSTETGGIAWRQHEPLWQLFDGLRLNCVDNRWWLHSPYLNTESIALDDQVSLQEDGRFILQGRLDRIVKIEEKRLSLSELERHLIDTPWVADAFTVPLAKSRDVVGAAVALTEAGFEQLKSDGRNAFIKQLRTQLYQWFEPIVLPRKWLFLDDMPLTSQGKINQQLLNTLLNTDNQKFPQVQSVCASPNKVELTLRVPEDLIYFPDHFADYPILPGVVQIKWAEYFGNLFFNLEQPFLTMEVIKFVKPIQPGNELTLMLHWNTATHKLLFNFRSGEVAYSSGRLIYTAKQRDHHETLHHHSCL